MAISSETASISYTGNDSTVTAYAVPFKFIQASHLLVVVTDADGVETILEPTTGFVASGAGAASGSLVTVAAYDSTHTIAISRQVPFTQPYVFSEGSRLPMASLENAFDLQTMQNQRLAKQGDSLAASLATLQSTVDGLELGDISGDIDGGTPSDSGDDSSIDGGTP